MTPETKLLTDKEVGRLLSLSASWVRNQRFKRSHGEPHVFKIDPVYVTPSSPRYVRHDVEEYIDGVVKPEAAPKAS